MPSSKNGRKIDSNVVQSIKKSSEKFGQLYPILVDFNDETIDGIHRQIALDNPKIYKVEGIKTKRDRLEARLVANHARKGQHKSTWVPTLNELAKILERQGVEKIGMKIAEETGLPYRTIMRYLPSEFKDKAQAERASHPRLPAGSPLETLEKATAKSLVPSPAKTNAEISKIPTQPVNEVVEYNIDRDQPKPRIEVKRFPNQPWRAIIVPKDFFEKLEKASMRRNVDIENAITLALMKLLQDLRSKKGCLQERHR